MGVCMCVCLSVFVSVLEGLQGGEVPERQGCDALNPGADGGEAAALVRWSEIGWRCGVCLLVEDSAERVDGLFGDVGVEVDAALAAELHADAVVVEVHEEALERSRAHVDVLHVAGWSWGLYERCMFTV